MDTDRVTAPPTPPGDADAAGAAGARREDAENSDNQALPAVSLDSTGDGTWNDTESARHTRTWRQEVPRWLATLDSQRTRREYEKAVAYFFATPGISQSLGDLSFDLLLAYRGSLALRADRQRPTAPAPPPASARPRHELHTSPSAPSLSPGDAQAEPLWDDGTAPGNNADGHRSQPSIGPLAPATVNIRLTALRQFLTHCSLWDLLPQLSVDRMRMALRRLHIERRRPYQVLAELEWAAFLAAARAPAQRVAQCAPTTRLSKDGAISKDVSQPQPTPDETPLTAPAPARSVWGMTRAARQREVALQPSDGIPGAQAALESTTPLVSQSEVEDTTLPSQQAASQSLLTRSRAGLTGTRTALRDHALLALALATGLRAIELCGLDLGDIRCEWSAGKEEWWLVLPDAKTKGQRGGRTLPLAPALLRLLFEYITATGRQWGRADDHRSPLFLSLRRTTYRDGLTPDERARFGQRRLTTDQVRRIVDRVETQWMAARGSAGDGESAPQGGDARAISPHALRHSTAVALLEGNARDGRPPASVEHVRGWLGHFDIRTTQGYLAHLDARRTRRPFTLASITDEASAPVPPSDVLANTTPAPHPSVQSEEHDELPGREDR